MSLTESLIAAELSSRKGEQDVFRRLQERNAELKALKTEMAAMTEQHEKELRIMQDEHQKRCQREAEQREDHVGSKNESLAQLRELVDKLTTDSAAVVESLRHTHVTGIRAADRLQPRGLLDPEFMPEFACPAVVQPAAELREPGSHDYPKLNKVIKSASGALPGDQEILRCIQVASQMAQDALHSTDSVEAEDECISRMRAVLRYVLDCREKCAWGDYVRPSQQHVEGPDISAFSNMIDIDRGLSKQEAMELEQLAKQQDVMQDPLGLASLKEKNIAEIGNLQAELDEKISDIQCVQKPAFAVYQAQLDAAIAQIRSLKESRISEEYRGAIAAKERELIKQKAELGELLRRVGGTLKDINELQVCQKDLRVSLTNDEKAYKSETEVVAQKVAKLDVYEQTLVKRKAAIAAVGRMEEAVVSHIQELLLERGRDLFEGKSSMLMRQYEVLPNVYCQCSILEGL